MAWARSWAGTAPATMDADMAAECRALGLDPRRIARPAPPPVPVLDAVAEDLARLIALRTCWRQLVVGDRVVWTGIDWQAAAALITIELDDADARRQALARLRACEEAIIPVLNDGRVADADEPDGADGTDLVWIDTTHDGEDITGEDITWH